MVLIFLRKQHLLCPILFLCIENTPEQHVGSGGRLGKGGAQCPAVFVQASPDSAYIRVGLVANPSHQNGSSTGVPVGQAAENLL